ncbi:DUF6600 domain-containing protein [Legionella impletisoli]|uniref:Proline-rich exported protein n=1 Tax=Legionella impletisoli TaxID=343510 RepID=A0A917JYK9_9GAMM|nr:DUF6600 domain-containing protein [Legionella impletisoli]GGI92425.1 proline-rich exported protein [Legionella impletisoli]
MMNRIVNYLATYLLSIIISTISLTAYADDPGEVARLSFTEGPVSFLPAGENKWVKPKLNRPLITSDRLWSETGAKVELQLPNALIHMAGQTSLKITNLTHTIKQLQISQGTLILQLLNLKSGQTYEIDTPNLAFVMSKPGTYRVDVLLNSTQISVIKGSGKAFGSHANYEIQSGYTCRFTGTNLSPFSCAKIGKLDTFAQWSMERVKRLQQSAAAKHVSPSLIGHEALVEYGQWKTVKRYGKIWTPDKVPANWAPYRMGQWTWISGWGWTWVDDQPWGFAPFHYGRWVYIEEEWGWVPGPIVEEVVYAPALVVFVGDSSSPLQLSSGVPGVAWFPLGPGEVYIPPYEVSQNYFIQVNTSNTIINQADVINIYNNPPSTLTYQNATTPTAVTAVPAEVFVQSEPVMTSITPLSAEVLTSAPKSQVAPVAPESTSVLGTNTAASAPPEEITQRSIVVKNEPPPPPVPFSETEKLLEQNPGVPLSSVNMKKLQNKNTAEKSTETVVPVAEETKPAKPTAAQMTIPEAGQPESIPLEPGIVEPQTAPETTAPAVTKPQPESTPTPSEEVIQAPLEESPAVTSQPTAQPPAKEEPSIEALPPVEKKEPDPAAPPQAIEETLEPSKPAPGKPAAQELVPEPTTAQPVPQGKPTKATQSTTKKEKNKTTDESSETNGANSIDTSDEEDSRGGE